MNNETKQNITIKLRSDGVYDIYANGAHVVSKGNEDGVLDEVKKLLEERQ